MDEKKSVLAGLIVLVAVIGLAIFAMQQTPATVEPGGKSVAPDIATTTLDGQPWKLREQRGKVVLMDFWATWCGPCLAAMPHMKAVHERFKSDPDFVMVGVSLDYARDDAVRFLTRQPLPWLQLFDPNQPLAQAFRVDAIPSVWVIGRDGRVAGSQLEGDQIEKTIAAALARK